MKGFARPDFVTSPGTTVGYVLAAVLIVALASAVRILLFGELGRGTAYLTYYPAVVLAALYGGARSGLLATGLSGLLCFFWIQKGYMSTVESMAMGVFLFSCVMISGIAEAMRRAQAQAREAQMKAESANRAKSDFLARMSHELRTPLNAILGFTNILRGDSAIPEKQQQLLHIVNTSGEHLLAMINDVLDMAKIDAGRMEVVESAVDLHEMGREIIQLMTARSERKGLLLKHDVAANCPQYVQCDPNKLRQALLNLLGNAIKFTEQGQVILRLASRPGDSPQHLRLVIEVEDSGNGIPAADQAAIFEPFVQARGNQNQKGTGLGLGITRRFVELMGGTISLRSEPGVGSVFRIELPVRSADKTDTPTVNSSSRVIRLAPGQSECRVLIVEDQMENWALLQHILEVVGFQVRVAQNGLEGVAAFAEWQPQLIWMDVRMPVMDGLEATRRIRMLEGGDKVRILAVTASVFAEERDRILSAGMDDLLMKPYRPDAIYDAMERFLGVSFIRGNHADAPPQTPDRLDAAQLADLPAGMRDELRSVLLTLDAAKINDVIRRIAETDPGLAEVLSHQANRYDFTAILEALNIGGEASMRGATL